MYKMPPPPAEGEELPGPPTPPQPGSQDNQDTDDEPGEDDSEDDSEDEVAQQVQSILAATPEMVKKFAIPETPNRELTIAEQRADITRLFTVIAEGEDEGTAELSQVMRTAEKRTLRWLDSAKQVTSDLVGQYEHIPNFNSLQGTVRDLLTAAVEDGARTAADEIERQVDFRADFTPQEQLAYLDSKSLTVAQATDQAVVSQVKQALLTGVAQGQTLEQVKSRIREIFAEYDGEISGHRAEVIVRTNYNDAFNQGRLRSMAAAGEFVQGAQFSAVIDGRETEVCRSLDGKVFRLGSPEMDRLTPPRHHQCRSLWVPVMIGQDIDQADRINQSQADRAIELSGKGF